jgi:hypothetical protein
MYAIRWNGAFCASPDPSRTKGCAYPIERLRSLLATVLATVRYTTSCLGTPFELLDLGDRLVLRHDTGHAELREPYPSVFVTRYFGAAPAVVYAPFAARMNARLAEGRRVSLSIDATALALFESEFRQRWTEWIRDNKNNLDDVNLLFSSRLVMMGAALVNATIGPKIKSFAEPERFEAAIAAAIEARRELARSAG